MNPLYLMENSRVKAALALCNAFYEPQATRLYFTYMGAKYDGQLLEERTPDEIMEEVDAFRAEFSNMENLEFPEQQHALHQYLEAIRGTDEIYSYFLELLYNNPDFPSELQYSQDFQMYGKREEKKMEQKYEGAAICTAHSSKGLEWPVVFATVTKFDKKSLHRGHASDNAVEEVRRLLFVTMTRAREELYVTGQYKAYGTEAEGYTYNQFLEELYKIKGQAFDPVDHEAEAEKAAKEAAAKAKRAQMAAAKRAAKSSNADLGLAPRMPYAPAGTGKPNKTVKIPQRNTNRKYGSTGTKSRAMTDAEKAEYNALTKNAVQTSVLDWI
jgi:superfamily I DNA/RNA helicase